MTERPHHRVAIIGAGFGGIGTSIKLAERGIDHVIFEKMDDVGGTWWANKYPGCRCDVPSHLYSFSFALNPDWSDTFSLQPEIHRYLRTVAEDFNVIPRISFNTAVTAARWDDNAKRWDIETSNGSHTADVLVSAHGFLSEPSWPDIKGLSSFGGQVMHSAQWDPSYDVSGKRVAVVGTGASAVQIVPKIQQQADQLLVFQRTPGWVLPHRGRPIRDWERAAYRRMPAMQRLVRNAVYLRNEFLLVPPLMKNPARLETIRKMALEHLEAQVPDPQLRAKLTPTYSPGCKRLLPSNEYLPAIAAANTTLVTDRINEVVADGIVTADGTRHEFDVLVLATGFKVTDNTFGQLITGRNGLTLQEVWGEPGMSAYNGTTISGFPNFFMLAGPNTGIGHTSLVYMIEAQWPYLLGALDHMATQRVAAVDVRPDVQAAFNEMLQRKLATTVWNTGGCKSWYLDKNGRNSTIWPDFTFKFAKRLKRFDVESYYQELAPVAPDAAFATV